MIIFLIIGIVAVLGAVFGVAFSITGAVLSALLWMLRLPIAVVLWLLGAVCCCTIILIPVGLLLFRTGTAVII